MTSQPSELSRKVTQLDDDVMFIYQKLDQMDKRQQRFAREVRKRFDAHDGRLEVVDSRLEAVDAGLGTIVARLGGVDGALTEVLRRLPEPPA